MASKRETIKDWLQNCFNDDETGKKGEPTAIALLHLVGGVKEIEVDTVTLGTGKQWGLQELAERFTGKAEAYAQDLTGVQTFLLLAFWDSKEPQARKPFKITGATEFGSQGLESEGPTPTGLTQQAMRHNEVVLQTTLAHTRQMLEMSQGMMLMVTNQNNRLMTENTDQFGVIRDMLMRQVETGHDKRLQELEYQRSTEERNALIKYVPSLINSITGREVFSEEKADSALLDSLAGKLTPEMVEQMSKILPPEIVGPLSTRLQKSIEAKNALSTDGANRLQNGLDPEAEVSGDMQDEPATIIEKAPI